MLELITKINPNSQNVEHDLIRLCTRLESANQELHDFFSAQTEDVSGPALENNQAQWEAMAFRAAQLPATTLAGVRARVRALGGEFVADILRSADLTDEAERAMIEALIRDLTGME
jgi:hypothetical protein